MGEIQGEASIWVRHGWLAIVAESILAGWEEEDGICRGRPVPDFQAYSARFPMDSTPAVLGAGLRTALAASKIGMTCSWEEQQLAIPFEKRLAELFQTSQRHIFSDMRHCSVIKVRAIITFQPMRRKRGGTFLAMADDIGLHETTINHEAEDSALGEALRECLDRCR